MIYNKTKPCWALLGLDAPYDSSDIKEIKALCLKKGPPGFVIAADGGYDLVESLGFCPNAVIGDMDSMPDEKRKSLEKRNVPVIVYPTEKDKTDSHLALEFAKNAGYSEIILVGALGGRLDHTIANIYMMASHLRDSVLCEVRLIGGGHEAVISESQTTITGKPGEIVSLIPLTPTVEGITITGFYYPLYDAALKYGETVGVSNYLKETTAFVCIRSGTLLILRHYR
ncbi:MAG: thiamine diphosphokinase [Firmicutes bacterium]|nr:thiamine diphosphokinase [Bacillota bacterium]